MGDKSQNVLMKDLSSLGCAFAIGSSKKTPDPEMTIIHCLHLFWEKQDLFSMLLGVLYYKIHDLVHVERLYSLAKGLSDNEKILLKVIAYKLVLSGDKRYNLLVNKLETKRKKLSHIPEEYSAPYLLKKWGYDKSFLHFKMKVPDCLLPPERKFYTKATILKKNPWLRLRTLIGPTYRADLVYLKSAQIVSTPVEAFKLLGCSRAVTYDLWAKLAPLQHILIEQLI